MRAKYQPRRRLGEKHDLKPREIARPTAAIRTGWPEQEFRSRAGYAGTLTAPVTASERLTGKRMTSPFLASTSAFFVADSGQVSADSE